MPAIPEASLALVEKYCERRVPQHVRDQVRLECSVRGKSITITERRPPWRPEFGPEWTSLKVAQLRYDKEDATWTLYCCDRNERWFEYNNVGPSADIEPLLVEIDADPTGIFWG
jgi:hypothetical protein